jgi:hypothetical protein
VERKNQKRMKKKNISTSFVTEQWREGKARKKPRTQRKRESRWPTLWIMTSMRPTLPPLRYVLSHGFETREGVWNANDCREEEKRKMFEKHFNAVICAKS